MHRHPKKSREDWHMQEVRRECAVGADVCEGRRAWCGSPGATQGLVRQSWNQSPEDNKGFAPYRG